jgi:hypothetical protein
MDSVWRRLTNLNPLRSSDLTRATRASLCFWSNTEPVIERAAPRLEGNLPPLLRSLLQYKLHSSEHFLQSAGHAVLGTLCSRAHRIGLDGTSPLLGSLRKNVSFSFSIVVIVCVLVCPASEVVVLAEEHLQGFGDHVRRRSISDRSQLEMEHGSCRIAEAVLIVRRS